MSCYHCNMSQRNSVHHNPRQYGYHEFKETVEMLEPAKRTSISREVAIQVLQNLACKQGDDTTPTEDVIDIAQAVLALLGER
jgi:hypothetical protein